ncbi:hypothetical protein FOZ63_008902 [Perkinsus olseni]|uniref:Uncharacterized protein n=1 Tax=Perkinsus olseni TaxID=32597 RepID=A0A7J6UIH5_PEROL|nr:hypothetical protein FOZ63_008902 [Perkinsus olseni]
MKNVVLLYRTRVIVDFVNRVYTSRTGLYFLSFIIMLASLGRHSSRSMRTSTKTTVQVFRSGAKPTHMRPQGPVGQNYEKTNPFYWPPEDTSDVVQMPGGRKQFFVFAGKSDEDGSLEPTLAIVSRGGRRLVFFNEEELAELERLGPRYLSYLKLWQQKARRNQAVTEAKLGQVGMADDHGKDMD